MNYITGNPLLQRLEGLDARFEETATLITDPAVIADRARYVKLTKEYRDLEKILDAVKRYRSALLSIEESQAVMSDEADPEMRQLAREEFEEASSKLPGLEEEIKLLLVPADPDDSKNAIVEIRGGTGGDEAALLQATFFVCIRDMRRRKAGSWPCRAFRKVRLAVSRRLFSA